MSNLNIIDDITKHRDRLTSKEQILGKGLMMPFNSTNSGSRKIMQSVQIEHLIPLINPEIAIIQTGFENRFGDKTSSISKSKSNYKVLEKIEKIIPDNYYLLIKDLYNNSYDIIERKSYEHTVENYGYLYNNEYIDSLKQNSIINYGDVVQKSTSYDEYNNRIDGINLNATYMSNEYNKEDGIIISKSASYKLSSPLIKKIRIKINDNDIPLNIYGDDNIYKSFPNIGEYINNGILCALRREKIEDCLFSQSSNRLKKIMMSDEKFTAEGKVIDINVFCNNYELLKNKQFTQIKYYYDKYIKYINDFINKTNNIIKNYKCSYDLQKMNYIANQIKNETKFVSDKLFSNVIIDFYIMETIPVNIGDKISNRYGGKGVISKIIDDELMPETDDNRKIDIIWNSSTCINRENIGQLFETEINNISCRIIEYMNMRVLDFEEALDMYIKFISIISEKEGKAFANYIKTLNVDDQMTFVELLCSEKGILLSVDPLTEYMTIDKLDRLYKEFPFANQYKMKVPQIDSNGNIRYIMARRPLSCGYQYVYRLKQYAEDKFSVVSLAATNILNKNSRNNSKKNYKSIHSRTPIKFGEMESGNLIHLGVENVIINLMIHSISPQGRKLCKNLLTDDPFNPNIILDATSKNRNAEILNAFLLTIGLELEFIKEPKQLEKIFIRYPFKRKSKLKQIFKRVYKNENFDYDAYIDIKNRQSKNIFIRFPFKRNEVDKNEK